MCRQKGHESPCVDRRGGSPVCRQKGRESPCVDRRGGSPVCGQKGRESCMLYYLQNSLSLLRNKDASPCPYRGGTTKWFHGSEGMAGAS